MQDAGIACGRRPGRQRLRTPRRPGGRGRGGRRPGASDAWWLGLAAPALGLYDGKYRVVQGRAPTAFLLYALLAAGVSSRVVASSVALAARAGALLGLLAFGTFNITHWALSERWDATIGLIDTAYGIVKWTSALSAQHFAADLF